MKLGILERNFLREIYLEIYILRKCDWGEEFPES